MIIYLATNKINNKQYVGQTIEVLTRRIAKHVTSRRTDYFHKAIRKYGRENFDWIVLAEAETLEALNELEIKYIKEYNSLSPNGYNIATGGRNAKHTEETKLKLSELAKQQWANSREKILNSMQNMPVESKEAQRNRGKARKGIKHTEATREKMRLSHKLVSKETRLKMSESGKLRSPMSEETKQKIANTLRSKKYGVK